MAEKFTVALGRLRTTTHHILNWMFQRRHKAHARKLRTQINKVFTEHPKQTGETYLEHLWFTAKMSSRLFYTSTVLMLHGMLPFVWVRTASNQIETIYRIMKMRIPIKRRQEIDKEITFPPNRPVLIHSEAKVAIVGGGFSGTMVLANLIEQASGPFSIEWFEEDSSMGTGMAYGTTDTAHLLNVRASGMGALAGRPEHFYHWLKSEEGRTVSARLWPGRDIAANSFVPRALYAEYLHHMVRTSLAKAKEKNIHVTIHHARVIDASLYGPHDKLLITAKRQGTAEETLVDVMMLATGNLRPKRFDFQRGLVNGRESYITDVWNAPAGHLFPDRIHELPADSEVVIIGTGLTMIDTVLTLRTRGYKGTITAISRHGLLPCVHQQTSPYPAWDLVLAPQFAPRTALGLFIKIRGEIALAAKKNIDWRVVIDSLRPVTQQLWKQLPRAEKRRFFSKLSPLWSIHRHRMAPEIYNEIKTLQHDGTLKIVAGKIHYIGSDKDGLTVAYRKRGTNRIETMRSALVLNCTGPEGDIASSDHVLLKNLRDREMITVGPLRAGIEMTDMGTAKGKASHALFPMGTLLMGELLECTAVPELREQAAHIAASALEQLHLMYADEAVEKHAAGEWI